MKHLRPMICLLLCAAMLFGLFACSSGEPAETAASSASEKATAGTAQSTLDQTTNASGTQSGYVSAVPIFTTTPASQATTTAASQTTTQGVTFTTDTEPPATSQTTTAATTTAATTPTPTTPPQTSSLVAGSVLLPVAAPSTDTRGLTDSQIFSFFDDAVFVGDSISLGWRNYVSKVRKSDSLFFGGSEGAQFLVSGSLGAGNSLWAVSGESVHPAYQGEQMQLWQSIPLTGAKKVFVMFGLNDVGLYGVEKTIENFGTLFGKIKAAVPDVQFYVLSATYVKAGGERGKLTSANLRALNLALIDFCHANGYEFINIADPLADTDGNLKASYCSDGYVHQTTAAYDVWTALLKGYAASKLS